MDAVVDPEFAVTFSKLGGLAVLNLEGVQTRYEDPSELLEQIANATLQESTELLQRIYSQPIQESLIARRVEEIGRGRDQEPVVLVGHSVLESVVAPAGDDDLLVLADDPAAVLVVHPPRPVLEADPPRPRCVLRHVAIPFLAR